jgi:hypothetical protein
MRVLLTEDNVPKIEQAYNFLLQKVDEIASELRRIDAIRCGD